jgi:hypothetical protein
MLATMHKGLIELDAMLSSCRIIMSRRVIARSPLRTAPLNVVRQSRKSASRRIEL